MSPIVVVAYDPSWPESFERLRATIWPVVSALAISIEHVGSTSVPGLAAKPVIDLDLVVGTQDDVPAVIERLATLGYRHRGDLGITGREAFQSPAGTPPHHLYVCPVGNEALANHLALRRQLRQSPERASAYGALKQRLARRFADDIDGYVAAKTAFIVEVLREAGLSEEQLERIEQANRR